MSEGKNHSERFKKYLRNELTSREQHDFERDALDDLFTQEALDGYDMQGVEHLDELDKLRNSVSKRKGNRSMWLRYATAAILILSGTFSIYYFTGQFDQNQKLAIINETLEEQTDMLPNPDTIPVPKEVFEPPEDAQREALNTNVRVEETVKAKPTAEKGEEEAFYADIVAEEEQFPKEQLTSTDLEDLTEPTEPLPIEPMESEIQLAQVDEAAVDAEPLMFEEATVTSIQEKKATEISKRRTQKANTGAVSRSLSAGDDILTGKVTSETGDPLPGVTISIKGTNTGALTDSEGNYRIPKFKGSTLTYSFIGFETKEIDVTDQDSLNVTLENSSDELQEVVVVGYGTNDDVARATYSVSRPVIGYRKYKTYLEENLQYPASAIDHEIEGTVILQVTISATGSIARIDVRKSIGYGCDQEAIRLVQEGPEWEPAIKDGITTEDQVRIKVKFKQ